MEGILPVREGSERKGRKIIGFSLFEGLVEGDLKFIHSD